MTKWMVFMKKDREIFFRLITAETFGNATTVGLMLPDKEYAVFLGVAPCPESEIEPVE